jgi:hypothetical protein
MTKPKSIAQLLAELEANGVAGRFERSAIDRCL